MKRKITAKTVLRVLSQLLFLGLFAFLLTHKKLQLWMPVFAAGVLLSLIFSRFYCGWMCPMGTLFRPINWIYSKLGIKRLKTPGIFRNSFFRFASLLLIAAGIVLTLKFKIRINILLYVTVLSVIITLFFEETFWHHHLCPYGALLSLSGRPAPLSVKIDEENCTSCGLCQKVCPSEAIVTLDSKKRRITKNECLVCFKCQEVCPADVINYKA